MGLVLEGEVVAVTPFAGKAKNGKPAKPFKRIDVLTEGRNGASLYQVRDYDGAEVGLGPARLSVRENLFNGSLSWFLEVVLPVPGAKPAGKGL